MHLPTSWYSRINKTNFRVVRLVTIGPGKLSEIKNGGHPATWGGVVRASTHHNIHIEDTNGRSYPFWPTIFSAPEIRYTYSPDDRRVEDVSTTLSLLDISGFSERYIEREIHPDLWIRIDLWTDGITLEDTVPIFAGPITNIQRSHKGASVSIQAQDTFDGIVPEFNFGSSPTLDKAEFPKLPDELDGKAKRYFLLNNLPGLFPCTRISDDGLQYYVCEPFMSPPPNEFFIGSQKITGQIPRIARGRMAVTGTEFTKLILTKRPQSQGLFGDIFVRGGSGPNTYNAIEFFIDRVPNLELTSRAKRLISSINRTNSFDYFVVVANNGNPIDILTQRILPQSNLIPFFRGNRLDMIAEGGRTKRHNFTLGGNLHYPLDVNRLKTPTSSIYNAIDVFYTRKTYTISPGESYSRNAVLVDKNYGGTIGSKLARSEKEFGRKYLKIDAADLYSYQDAARLGETIATTSAFSKRFFAYHTSYKHALFMDINDQGLLTDPLEGFTNKEVRISGMTFGETGVRIDLYEDI